MAETESPRRRDRPRLPGSERHRQIMEASTALIAERGYWGLSMQDVADHCGLTVPGLLRYVGSKTGLLIAVLDYRDTHDARALGVQLGLGEPVRPDVAAHAGPRVTLRQLCSAMMRRNAGQPEIVRLDAVLKAESLAPGHPAHDYFAARQERTLTQFARLAKGAAASPDVLARRVLATMDGIQLQWLRSPDRIDLVRAWQDAADLLFAGLDEQATSR